MGDWEGWETGRWAVLRPIAEPAHSGAVRIAVLVKQVPDGELRLTPGRTVDRDGDGVLSPLDEFPLQAARTLAAQARDRGDQAEVIAVTMGPPDAVDALRSALQLGADRAVHVCDERLAAADAGSTAQVLAAAVRSLAAVDLVLAGAASADAGTGLVPSQVAALLGIPALVGATKVTVHDDEVRARIDDEDAELLMAAPLPALVTVTDHANPAQYPTLREVRAARTRPVLEMDLDDLGIAPPPVRTRVEQVVADPPRPQGRLIHDDGTAGLVLAGLLRTALRTATATAMAGNHR